MDQTSHGVPISMARSLNVVGLATNSGLAREGGGGDGSDQETSDKAVREHLQEVNGHFLATNKSNRVKRSDKASERGSPHLRQVLRTNEPLPLSRALNPSARMPQQSHLEDGTIFGGPWTFVHYFVALVIVLHVVAVVRIQ